jgi:hypothetical protein
MMSDKPWECPRCRTWHGPSSRKCDCKPIKREYCPECLSDAFSIFKSPLPEMDVIYAYAEHFHKNFSHRNIGTYDE